MRILAENGAPKRSTLPLLPVLLAALGLGVLWKRFHRPKSASVRLALMQADWLEEQAARIRAEAMSA